MPNYTKHLNLEQPSQEEYYNVEVHNQNSEKIDKAIESIDKKLNVLQGGTEQDDDGNDIVIVVEGDNVTIEDKNNHFDSDTVEGALDELAQEVDDIKKGKTKIKAVNVTIDDKENIYDATDVEGALQEVMKKANEAFLSGDNAKQIIRDAINSKNTVSDVTLKQTWQEYANAIKAIKEGRGNAQPSHVLEPYTFTNDEGRELTGSIPNRGNGRTITPTTTDINLDYGYYATKNIIKGDTNLKPENIKKGIRIFGVDGSMVDTSIIINKYFSSSSGRSISTSLYFNPMPINAYDYEVTITLMGETFVRTGNDISVDTSNGDYTASVRFIYVQAESNWDSEGTKVDINASCTDVYDVSLGGVGIKIKKIR